MPIDALSVLCAQLTCDLFAIAKFLLSYCILCAFVFFQHRMEEAELVSASADGVASSDIPGKSIIILFSGTQCICNLNIKHYRRRYNNISDSDRLANPNLTF